MSRALKPPETGYGGGEDWWRDIDNAEAERTLAVQGIHTSVINTLEQTMDLFGTGQREAFAELVHKGSSTVAGLGNIAVDYRAITSAHYN